MVQVPENSGCVSAHPFWNGLSEATCNRNESHRHVREGFITDITMGDPYENGAARCCSRVTAF